MTDYVQNGILASQLTLHTTYTTWYLLKNSNRETVGIIA